MRPRAEAFLCRIRVSAGLFSHFTSKTSSFGHGHGGHYASVYRSRHHHVGVVPSRVTAHQNCPSLSWSERVGSSRRSNLVAPCSSINCLSTAFVEPTAWVRLKYGLSACYLAVVCCWISFEPISFRRSPPTQFGLFRALLRWHREPPLKLARLPEPPES